MDQNRVGAIEEEFDEPIGDVIQGMRDLGYTWITISGALGISRKTLVNWRRELGMPLSAQSRVYYRKADQQAKGLLD